MTLATGLAAPTIAVVQMDHAQGLPLPAYETSGAAGMDLRAAVGDEAPVTLRPGSRAMIPTGLSIAAPAGFEVQVRPRSGLAAKAGITKKELLILRREKDKLEKTLGGIRTMAKTPSALWVVDTNKEHLAITEAKKLGIPVIAILDTNCDPDDVTIGIPGNDDAIRSIELLTRVIADAAADGMIARHNKGGEEAEPLAEWERELLEAGEAKAAEVVAEAAAPAAEETPAEKDA